MIEFLYPEVEDKFKKLPLETQSKYIKTFTSHLKAHEVLIIQAVDYWGPNNKFLEISIRIDEKLDVVP